MQATPPKVMRAPRFPRLKENPPRTGFLTDENFARLAAACAKEGLWLRAMLEVARSYGWRIAELQNLHVKQVDLFARTIRLEPGSTKNEDGREVAMTDAIFTLLTECVQGKSGDDYVFTRRNGKRIADFRGTWHKVCCATRLGMMHCMSCGQPVAGNHCETCRLPWRQNQLRYRGLLWHDLRRTAVRNLVRSGISEKIAMTVTGHRTRSVFDRYAIIAASDLREAALKMQARDAAVAERLRNVTDLSHVSVTVAPLPAAAVVN